MDHIINDEARPLFSGSTDEVVSELTRHPSLLQTTWVCPNGVIGDIVPAQEYLARFE